MTAWTICFVTLMVVKNAVVASTVKGKEDDRLHLTPILHYGLCT